MCKRLANSMRQHWVHRLQYVIVMVTKGATKQPMTNNSKGMLHEVYCSP